MTIEQGRSRRREFARFLAVGALAAGINVAVRYVLSLWIMFEWAVLLAYIAGMITAFPLSRRYVYEASGRKAHDEFIRFTLVNLVGAAQVWLISVGLVRLAFPAIGFTWHAEDVAHLIGVASPIFTAYFGHRHFSFAHSGSS